MVSRGDGRRDEIALTFDDGPSRWTAEIAAVFEVHGCHATFFLRGPAIGERPEQVAALAAAGHELGNHLWSHSDATTQSREELREELERTADAVERAGAPRPDLVRPPYFKGPENVAAAAAGLGVRAVVRRSIAVDDWAGVSGDKRYTDSRRPTAEVVRMLVPALLERSLRPVTVTDLLAT